MFQTAEHLRWNVERFSYEQHYRVFTSSFFHDANNVCQTFRSNVTDNSIAKYNHTELLNIFSSLNWKKSLNFMDGSLDIELESKLWKRSYTNNQLSALKIKWLTFSSGEKLLTFSTLQLHWILSISFLIFPSNIFWKNSLFTNFTSFQT